MGTRGITEITYQGEIKVSQYGQWDHYPSGQGLTIFDFLSDPENVELLKSKMHLVYQATSEEIDELAKPFCDEDGRMFWEEGKKFSEKYPSLTRDTGGGILEVIANTYDPLPVSLDLEFKDDTLFCEGVYEINLDKDTFTTKNNRYENPNGEDVLTLTFLEVQSMTPEEYLQQAKCGVYQYHLLNT